MVAYSFKSRFSPPITAGTKRQTIRADRKRHARPGETMQLYTGMRTKQCRLIGTATCLSIQPITIDLREAMIVGQSGNSLTTIEELDDFARRDGFDGWFAMRAFWHDNHPEMPIFTGVLIRWTNFRPSGQRTVPMTDPIFGTASLGELIDILAQRPADERQVRFSDGSVPSGLTSYRGYYDHLAITPATDRTEIVCNLLAWLLQADGKKFTGYKGGVYRMDRSTPVWCSPYDEASGLAIVGISESNGVVTLSTCPVEEDQGNGSG